jgi:hypothetical protein
VASFEAWQSEHGRHVTLAKRAAPSSSGTAEEKATKKTRGSAGPVDDAAMRRAFENNALSSVSWIVAWGACDLVLIAV